MMRNCSNCKHFNKGLIKGPCKICFIDTNNFEPLEDKKMFKAGDIVKAKGYKGETRLIVKNICVNKFLTVDGDEYRIGDFELVEENKINIKINNKAAMTEYEQRQEFAKLINKVRTDKLSVMEYIDLSMAICKNEPQEVESVEITLPNRGSGYAVIFTSEQVRQIQAIKL